MPDHLTVGIDDMLKNLSSTPSKPSMFRVDKQLRSINPEAYDPRIVAIGPFHRGSCKNKKLQKMEQHKERYLRCLLKRKGEPSVGKYVPAIRQLEEEARKCYPKDMKLCQDKDKFVQMLILDGCFIIEFLLKLEGQVDPEEDDPIFRYCYIQSHVVHDLMVFENQIPFSIIKCLFKMISEEDIEILISPWLENCIFPKTNHPKGFKIDGDHLLGIVHDMHCPSLSDEENCRDSNKMKNKNSAVELEKAGMFFKMLKKLMVNIFFASSDEDCGDPKKMKNINSAVELEKAGISFKKLEMQDINSAAEHKDSAVELEEAGISFKKLKISFKKLKMEDINSAAEHKDSAEAKQLKKEVMFHIEYGNKVMKIPEWKIDDSTESLFRNLIAYEYYLPSGSQRYVTDYICLMSCLVHSPEDAKLLRRRGIISNSLGSDEMVYDVIYKLNKNIIYSREFSYFKIFSQVNSHCNHRRNRWMAMLRRKYFNSPWAIISFFAAITLLLLAITQTVFAILSFR